MARREDRPPAAGDPDAAAGGHDGGTVAGSFGGRGGGKSGPWISVRSLDFHHGPRKVIDSLDLDFHPGRHYVLAGPNGAGKSTLLDLLCRLRKPSAGSIELMGRSLDSHDPGELARKVALAPQSSAFNFAFTVREVVRLGRRPHLGVWGVLGPEDKEAAETAIRRLGLGKLADKPVTALSGGEAQRVVLARTLAQSTPVLLLDEPTSSLDVAQALELLSVVRELAEDGRLVVTVSHDLAAAATYAHEIVFLKDGKLAAAGGRDEVLTDGMLESVFEAQARVGPDEFTGGVRVSFRRRPRRGGRPE
ncbi:MAG: ABC transporter ATP-binding protein [Deltaproteobacteria bacterium]|nr:ABC transporter ATP-binding protein [Deltaproteobacteria bacterium]